VNPKIIEVREATRLSAGGVPVQVLEVKWTAGNYGPFTTQSTWDELNNGTLIGNLQAQARSLANLPTS